MFERNIARAFLLSMDRALSFRVFLLVALVESEFVVCHVRIITTGHILILQKILSFELLVLNFVVHFCIILLNLRRCFTRTAN